MNDRTERLVNARHAKKYRGAFSLVGYGSGVVQIMQAPAAAPPIMETPIQSDPDSTCQPCGFVVCNCPTAKKGKKTKGAGKEAVETPTWSYPCAACHRDATLTYELSLEHQDSFRCSECVMRLGEAPQIRYGLFLKTLPGTKIHHLTHDFVKQHSPTKDIADPDFRERVHHSAVRISKFASGDLVKTRSGQPAVVLRALWSKTPGQWVYKTRFVESGRTREVPQRLLRLC